MFESDDKVEKCGKVNKKYFSKQKKHERQLKSDPKYEKV
jgi:hypothetical protein